MTRKVFPPVKEFLHLIESYYIKVMRFRIIEEGEFNRLISEGKAFPRKRKKKGKEMGLILEMNDFTIIVWTTFLLQEKRFRDADYAWVDVIKDGVLVYPSQRIMRTKNFLEQLTRLTLHRYEVVYGTPMCVQCRRFLDIVWPKMKVVKNGDGKIVELKHLGKRFRRCTGTNHRGKKVAVSIDNAISDKSKWFIMRLRDQRAKRKKAAKRKGKVYGIDRVKRFERRENVKII